jgi:hypothetical protein
VDQRGTMPLRLERSGNWVIREFISVVSAEISAHGAGRTRVQLEGVRELAKFARDAAFLQLWVGSRCANNAQAGVQHQGAAAFAHEMHLDRNNRLAQYRQFTRETGQLRVAAACPHTQYGLIDAGDLRRYARLK